MGITSNLQIALKVLWSVLFFFFQSENRFLKFFYSAKILINQEFMSHNFYPSLYHSINGLRIIHSLVYSMCLLHLSNQDVSASENKLV